MSSIDQLIILFISFMYGALFYFFVRLNKFFIKNHSLIIKYLFTFILIVDAVIVYIFLIYKMNDGIFHIYFLLNVGAGFFCMGYNYKKIVKLCKLLLQNKKKNFE